MKIETISPKDGEVLIFQLSGDGKTQFQQKFVDEDSWTVPVLLTKQRASRLLDDASVDRIRIIQATITNEFTPPTT